MQQVLQNIQTGKLEIAKLPSPVAQRGQVLIANRYSVISVGTEKMARELAQKSLLAKARERPDHVIRVLDKVRTEGLLNTFRQVRAKLGEPMPLGYCSSGVVIACGEDVRGFKPGDFVASNGPHAEVVAVPQHLCARFEDEASLEPAAFAVLGAIAMQGVRLSKLTLGETAFVIGLGLVGQITVALLKAAGARVIGTDLDPTKCELAMKMGADVARAGLGAGEVAAMTGELGADAVLITASTSSDGPAKLAGEAVRQKGRVVSVGAVDMNLDRRPFYFKEAEFVVSCSYGPGRYDPRYEEGGQDYPAAYVRWTEQRNMQSVLDLIASGKLNLEPLITHRFSIDDAAAAYELIEAGEQSAIGVVLKYPEVEAGSSHAQSIQLGTTAASTNGDKLRIGSLGAGNFARLLLLPKLCELSDVDPEIICSAGGQSAAHAGKQLGFNVATSSEADVIENGNVDAVFVITRHNDHARQVAASVRAGKHVFVEKPLCLSLAELGDIEQALSASGEKTPQVMVGFNRRFSPATRAAKQFFENSHGPKTISIRFNAGEIPANHWVQDQGIGGGRIIGEACHAIDLASYLCGSPVTRAFAESIGGPDAPEITDDQCFITLRHADGSVSNVAYLAGGDKSFSKERVEVFGDGRVAVIDDFRIVTGTSGGRTKRLWKGRQDKGHTAELEAFVSAARTGGKAPIPWNELRSTSVAAILAVRSLREGMPLDLAWAEAEIVQPIQKNVETAGSSIEPPLQKAS